MRNGNQHTGPRLDLQSLIDLLIDIAYSDIKLRVLGPAYGISNSEASRLARKFGICRRPKRRKIRPPAESPRLSLREMV